MKTKFILFLFFFSSNFYLLSGQSSTQDTLYRSIGVDAGFINNFLPLEFNIGSTGNYLFHYIKYRKNNTFIRQAFDLDFFGDFRRSEDVNDRDQIQVSFDYKIGKGKKRNVFKNASILYGLEGGARYIYNRTAVTRLSFDDEEYVNKVIGHTIRPFIGPFLGFEYKITKRLSVFTEGGVYLSGGYDLDQFKSGLDPENNTKEEAFSTRTLYRFPRSIILFYYF